MVEEVNGVCAHVEHTTLNRIRGVRINRRMVKEVKF
jgi:hypothetical protein